jgi:hypothetical protein
MSKKMSIGQQYRLTNGNIIEIKSKHDNGLIYKLLEQNCSQGFYVGYSVDGMKPDSWVEVVESSRFPFGTCVWENK